MKFVDVIRLLRADPEAYLDSVCAMSLGAFFAGYIGADSAPIDSIKLLLNIFPGRDAWDVYSRVYFSFASNAAGFSVLLDALAKIASSEALAPKKGGAADVAFVDFVRDPILRGHFAMLSGEATVASLYNYSRGFMSGLEVVAPEFAMTQIQKMAEFESWLQGRCQVPGAAWYKLIRVHYGPCDTGLKKFVSLWDEFVKFRPPS